MIGWLIFGGIVLLIVILLSLSVSLKFSYENDVDFKIKYFIFTLYPIKRKEKKRNKKRGKNKKPEKTEASGKIVSYKKDPEKKILKQAVSGKNESKKTSAAAKMDIKMIRTLLESFAHPFGRLFKKVRFNDIYIKSVVRAGDAAAVAINYGLQSAVISSFLAYLNSIAKVNIKEIKIIPDFNSYTDSETDEEEFGGETELYIQCKIKIRLASLLLFAIVSLWRFLKNNMEQTGTNSNKKNPKKGRTENKLKKGDNLKMG